jgi:dienelactone hydrolase
MRKLDKFYSFIALLFLSLPIFSPIRMSAQVQTARTNTPIDQYINGFYEYLPQGYTPGGQKYPLMVFLHGSGEIGDGSAAQLPIVLRNGPPKLISEGTFPTSFTVNGQTFKFIVISPQFNSEPDVPLVPGAVNDILDYAIAHYQVDQSKIYVTGLSMGGGFVWEYAGWDGTDFVKRLAGILPVSGAASPALDRCKEMAKFHLPVWATHNLNDPTVPSQYSIEFVHLLDSLQADPAPLITIFNASGHDAWTATYDPSFTQNGLNVYQWMLQYTRVGDNVTTNIILPVTLTDYAAALTGPSEVTVSWATGVEENNKYFIVQRSADGKQFSNIDTTASFGQSTGHSYSYKDENPLTGNNFYRLSQVDLDGKTADFGILEVTLKTPSSFALRVSPNPVRNTLNLQLFHPEMGSLQVRLSDAQGKIIGSWKFSKQQANWMQSLDITSLPAGSYFISVEGGKTIKEVRQFVKE